MHATGGADEQLFCGVDVGTQAARAIIVDGTGKRRGGPSSSKITTYRGTKDALPENFAEQSSEEIWSAVCEAVREAVSSAGSDAKAKIRGVGFCATCSLVALDVDLRPMTVSPTGAAERNIILWADHRAATEADEINATQHAVLDYVGGKVSPEMEMPKVLWLRRHMEHFPAHVVELPDFLTFRATGALVRSKCSLVCKFNYVAMSDEAKGLGVGWSRSFLEAIGLGDVETACFGSEAVDPGSRISSGLSAAAASQLGLCAESAVGASLIDAHSAALGVLGAGMVDDGSMLERIAIVAGTSNCFMTLSPEPIEVEGIWGPYASAIVPGMYCNEAGQSAGGLFISHVLDHPAMADLMTKHAPPEGGADDVFGVLGAALNIHCGTARSSWSTLSKSVHLTPDVCGNRSPYGRVDMTSVLSGVTMETKSEIGLLALYVAALQALAYGTRLVIDRLNSAGYSIKEAVLCGGGLARNEHFLTTLADVLQIPILLPAEPEAGLLGAALLGAVACGIVRNVEAGMCRFATVARTVEPDSALNSYHLHRYEIFKDLCQRNIAHAEIMAAALNGCSAPMV